MSAEARTSEQWEQLGTEKMEHGNFAAATNCFKQALAQRPDDCQILYKLGQSYMNQGVLENALECFDNILGKDPKNASAIARKGYVLECLGRSVESKSLCQQALELEPDSEEVLYVVGECFLNKDAPFAKELINKLLSKNPEHAEATYLMGLWHWFQQKMPEARNYFLRAISLDEHLKNRLYWQVYFFSAMKLEDLGLDFMNQCLSFDRDSSQYHKTKGELLLNQGHTVRALQELESAEAIDPKDPEIQYGLGSIHFAMGDHNAALNALNRTIELNPEHSKALTDLAAIYCDVFNNYPKALELVNKALKYDEELTTAWINRGIILSHIGNFTESISSFDQALAIEPDNSMAMLRKGGILNDNLQLHDEAIKLFNKAAQIDPKNLTCWWNLSQAFVGKNDFEQAIQYLDKVLEIEPMHAEAVANKAILLWRLGKNREARQTFIHLRQISPMDPRVNQALQAIPDHDNEGISGQLISILKKTAQVDPTIRNYLEGIARKADQLLATIFIRKMQEFFASDRAKQVMPDIATLATQELSRTDIDTLIAWLVNQGAEQILKHQG
ncbi:MAG: tetratricopeptide repeat protein [Candidatus Hodarchaeota archaeon]